MKQRALRWQDQSRRTVLAAGSLVAATSFFPGRARSALRDTVVDIHCHNFNFSDLPESGFVSHIATPLPFPIPGLRSLVAYFQQKLNKVAPTGDQELELLARLESLGSLVRGVDLNERKVADLLANAGSFLEGTAGKVLGRVVRLLYLTLHNRSTIAASLVESYGSVDLFTPSLVDYDAWSRPDRPFTPLATQIVVQANVARLSMRGQIGRSSARVHPFVAFDPLREVEHKLLAGGEYRPYGDDRVFPADGMSTRYDCTKALSPLTGFIKLSDAPVDGSGGIELVRFALERAGFLGVKVYPQVGFQPLLNEYKHKDAVLGKALDRALRAFYAYCEAEQVPITAHASGANGYGVATAEMGRPRNWHAVLRELPGLRVNFGHFGHLEGATGASKARACSAWVREAAALIDAYPNVYADLSNSALAYDEEYREEYFEVLKTIFSRAKDPKKLRHRLMYGSDWWLNGFGPDARNFSWGFAAAFEKEYKDAPEFAQDIKGRNALRFLGLLDEDNNKTTASASPNRRRLEAFYKAQSSPVSKPAWL